MQRRLLAVRRKSPPRPVATRATPENAEDFRVRQSPLPAAAAFFRGLLLLRLLPTVVFAGFVTTNPTLAVAGQFNSLDSVRPRVGQRGTTVTVTISGWFLKDAREIIFYRPGIKAVSIKEVGKPDAKNPPLECSFEIAADCPLGEHPFRVRTGTELSMAGTFQVTPFPVVDEVEHDKERQFNNNDTPEQAMLLAVNTTARGRIDGRKEGDVDCYRVPVTPGGRLTAEVDCVRISDVAHTHGVEPNASDLALRVLRPDGRELAANDDSTLHIQDPLISLQVPSDLQADHLIVEVTRSTFSTWPAPYALHVGNFRRPLAAFPPGGPPGEPLQVRFLGDPLGEFTETVPLPDARSITEWYGDAPSPLLLRSSPLPNIVEQPAAEPTAVPQLPAALNGIIATDNEADRYRLTVKKGDRYRVRVFAATLLSPLEPRLRIMPAAVETEATPEVNGFVAKREDRDIFGISAYGGSVVRDTLDPSVIWEPKQDGDYILELSDLTGQGDPTAVYRVEIEPAFDSVHVLMPWTLYWWEAPQFGSLAIPRGSAWTVNVQLKKGQGTSFNGETEIVAHGLPAGVRLLPNRIPADRDKWPLQFVADADAEPAASLVELEVRPVEADVPLVSRNQQNLPFLNMPGGDAWKAVRLDRFVVAVMDEPPFTVSIDEPPVPIVRGGELAIPVRITRAEGCDEPIGVQCDWVPKGIGRPPQLVIPPGETTGEVVLSADRGAPLGRQPLVLTATTIDRGVTGWLGHGQIRISTALRSLEIAEPFVELASEPDSIRRGQRQAMVWTVTHKTPFEGAATVRLLGLPKGVTLIEPLPTLTRDSREVSFELEATDDALLGSVGGLTCELRVPLEGREVIQRAGRGTLRIDPRLN